MITKEPTTEEKIDKAFGRKTYLPNKAKKRYPEQQEREMKRLFLLYLLAIKRTMIQYIPIIRQILENGYSPTMGYYGVSKIRREINDVLKRISDEVDNSDVGKQLQKEIEKVGVGTANHAVKEWKNAVKKTLRIEPDDSMLNRDYFHDSVSGWVTDVVERFSGFKDATLEKYAKKIDDAIKNEKKVIGLIVILAELLKSRKRVAGMEARDVVGSMNTKAIRRISDYFKSDEYIWITMKDDRVRECHASFHGKRFHWTDPPAIWVRKHGQIVYTGRRCNPGEDYGCRCIADFVFVKGKTHIIERVENV